MRSGIWGSDGVKAERLLNAGRQIWRLHMADCPDDLEPSMRRLGRSLSNQAVVLKAYRDTAESLCIGGSCVVCGILKLGNKVLLGKRSESRPLAGFWELPGGKMERKEHLAHVVIREWQEETGLCVKASRRFGPLFFGDVDDWNKRYFSDQLRSFVGYAFELEAVDPEQARLIDGKATETHSIFRWVDQPIDSMIGEGYPGGPYGVTPLTHEILELINLDKLMGVDESL
jgi:8-oxo-dGTP pyrophosphatase MutT (NUDIX family)